MRVFSTLFSDFDTLRSFISEHSEMYLAENLLIQIFSGNPDPVFLKSLTAELTEQLPQSQIIGATTDGEIHDGITYTENVVISFSLFEKTQVKIACIQSDDSMDSHTMGIQLGNALQDEKSKACILFTDGLNTNGEEFLLGVKSILKDTILAGGMAGDNAQFKRSFILCGTQVIQQGTVGAVLCSDSLHASHHYSFAWEPIGKIFTVNKAEKNRVYQIEKMTPYELYAHYLGEKTANMLPGVGIEFPLIIENRGKEAARAVLSTHEDGSLTFAGNIEEGSKVRFGIGNAEKILSSSFDLCKSLCSQSIEGYFIYSCMARRRFLENQINLETAHFAKVSHTSGFFTYGEFYTDQSHDQCHFMNETMTLLALSEDLSPKPRPNPSESKAPYEESEQATTLEALSHIIEVTSNELAELNEHLEQKVQEQTITLQEQNSELEKLNATLEEKIDVAAEKIRTQELTIAEQRHHHAISELLRNIAHHWRQPLNVINLCLETTMDELRDKNIQSPFIQKNYEQIFNATSGLSRIITEFSSLLRPNDPGEEKASLHPVLARVAKMYDSQILEKGVEVILMPSLGSDIQLPCKTQALVEIFSILFQNSLDAFEHNNIQTPYIKVDMEQSDTHCILHLSDNAGGIDRELIDSLFEPYTTIYFKTAHKGLGLYSAKQIAKYLLNGDIAAANHAEGSTFTISIRMSDL